MIGAETEVLRKNLPQYHFVHLKSLMAWPRLQTGLLWLTAWAMVWPYKNLNHGWRKIGSNLVKCNQSLDFCQYGADLPSLKTRNILDWTVVFYSRSANYFLVQRDSQRPWLDCLTWYQTKITMQMRMLGNPIQFMSSYTFLKISFVITLTEEDSLTVICLSTTVRTSNITETEAHKEIA
jgi:hypothetical protein